MASWLILKYPIPKDRLIALAKLYFQLSVTPGLPTLIVATCADEFKLLTKSKTEITIDDMRLPWKPVYDILSQDLFLSRRQFEYTFVSIVLAILFSIIDFFEILAIYRGAWVILQKIQGSISILRQSMRYSQLFYLSSMARSWTSVIFSSISHCFQLKGLIRASYRPNTISHRSCH